MTTPTKEAAEIVAGLTGVNAEQVAGYNKATSAPWQKQAYEFARYVTEETEVTDAMLEAGMRVHQQYDNYPTYRGDIVERIFRAMIAAKHKDMLPAPVDPLVAIAREMTLLDGVVRTDNQKAAIRAGRAGQSASEDFYDRLRTAISACGGHWVSPDSDERGVK